MPTAHSTLWGESYFAFTKINVEKIIFSFFKPCAMIWVFPDASFSGSVITFYKHEKEGDYFLKLFNSMDIVVNREVCD